MFSLLSLKRPQDTHVWQFKVAIKANRNDMSNATWNGDVGQPFTLTECCFSCFHDCTWNINRWQFLLLRNSPSSQHENPLGRMTEVKSVQSEKAYAPSETISPEMVSARVSSFISWHGALGSHCSRCSSYELKTVVSLLCHPMSFPLSLYLRFHVTDAIIQEVILARWQKTRLQNVLTIQA